MATRTIGTKGALIVHLAVACAPRSIHSIVRELAMDSINKNQREENRKDLGGEEAVRKIRELVEDAKTCFFCTAVSTSDSSGARPMNVRQVDGEGNLWFLSADDSHKNEELARDSSV